MPFLPLKMLRTKERIPISSSSAIFTFKLTFESYEEFGGVSFLSLQLWIMVKNTMYFYE